MDDARALFAAALFVGTTFHADAAIKDYQIIRLLTYKTDCQVGKLKSLPSTNRSLRFYASCENLTFYPEGVEVACDEPDDDRSCHVLTRQKTFDYLHALDRKD